jgi:hypothetical protein
MTTRSYFRVGSGRVAAYFFFDDESGAETSEAWEKALEFSRVASRGRPAAEHVYSVCAYRPARYPGSWDSAQVVGHRRQNLIENDPSTGVVDRVEERRRLDDAYALRRRGQASRS